MKKHLPCPRLFFLFLIHLFLAVQITGCSLLRDEAKLKEQKEKVELKIKNYNKLLEAIDTGTLEANVSIKDLTDQFGSPDDIFQSGSMTGSFQIWTYERLTEKDEDAFWAPIRLYIDNGKLVSWKY